MTVTPSTQNLTPQSLSPPLSRSEEVRAQNPKVLFNREILNSILQYAGPIGVLTSNALSQDMRAVLNQMNAVMLDQLSTDDVIVARDQNSVLGVALSDNAIVHKLMKARYSDAEDLLHILAQDLDQNVRVSVAKNPHTPIEIVVQLSGDVSVEVRRSVARNPHTPVEIVATLAQDNSDVVRSGVALNAKTPAFMLETLAEDSSVRVRIAVALNQKTPRLILEGLAQQDLQGAVRIRATNTLAIL